MLLVHRKPGHRAPVLVSRSGEICGGELPVHQVVKEGLDELGTHVAVVDVENNKGQPRIA